MITRLYKLLTLALTFFSLFTFCFYPSNASAQSNADVVVYMDSTAQLIRGFGAANIVGWRPDLSEEEVEKAFGMEEGQLGLSILRIRIPPNENQWSSNLATAQKAHEMGIKIIASPWSPPSDMKTNGDLVGGHLREDAYADYADFLNRFAIYMEENDAPLYGISIQNEPDIEVSYESCDWTPEEMTNFMRDHASSIEATRVIAPESFQFRREMSNPILNDSLAAANLDILGGHIYGGGNARYPLAEEKGKEIWMTEYLMNLGTGNSGSDSWSSYSEAEIWEETIDMLVSINSSMRNNWNAYIWWYLQRYYSFIGDGDEGTTDGEILKRGYAFSHFSRFIRPGFERVHSFGPAGRGLIRVYATAYKDGDKLVIVAINDEPGDKELTFEVEDGTPMTLEQYRSSVSQNVEQLEDVEVSGRQFTISMPSGTVTTLVADYLPVSNEKEQGKPTSFELKQNYPNPFNPSTVISYQLPVSSEVSLKVFDMLGREVASLVNTRQSAGAHQASFDASSLSSGMYIYRLQAGSLVQTRKMMLIK
ncbi:T9SS type A sorting domain-containing protein [Gracilimonas mengyeensis]|uniref:Glucuronoarabinoxylan endo-1,4-beta-xylanase n=1 Tax=Gracilimonas mengyeensis TaxID=1302730 RepID=A0A521AY87_9BACT|nr:T9SS type A sorting domain-containing protein [Gracilimonas mengyeensis]SMO39807.1 glucuronoarabinoxylan endo-1,4-beta-xylanase [Gracilimonas mengyeensis]